MNSNMILIFISLLSVLCLSAPGSVSIASGQVQMTDVKVLERGDDWQCPSMEERERARNEIHQIAASVIANISTLTTMATLTTTTASTTTLAVTTTSATTPVRVAYTLYGITILCSTPTMSSGMVRTVHSTAHAVSSTTLHGLQRTCLPTQLMTLN